jgi:hypothetical protein
LTAPLRSDEAKPPYRLCWWCNLQFQGPYFSVVTVGGYGENRHYVHKECVRYMKEAGETVEVIARDGEKGTADAR